MKILLLGATGRTGTIVLQEALAKGLKVRALARRCERLPKHPNLQVFEGDPSNIDDLALALESCERVIAVLNISRKSDFPWSALRSSPSFLSTVMRNLLELSQEASLQRIVLCSAWGVGDSWSEIPAWFQFLINNSNIGIAYQDHQRQEELLQKSPVPHTIVRPAGLTNGKKNQEIIESFQGSPKPKLTISRRSLATYLLVALEHAANSKVVVISGK